MEQKENLRELLAQGRLKPHKATAQGIGKLFAVVERDLVDAKVEGISLDRRFTIAYNVALQAGRALLAAEGYRTSGQAHHATIFQALRNLLGQEHHHLLDYMDDCRSKRNLAEYMGTEIASKQETEELIEEAQSFADLARSLIRRNYPHLLV
ncbi:MAG: hypothetical protein HY401_02130 [Elusimicrobia bacterium]|nr:hypothetical protein [Elusimicrobiota bacterium]